MKLVIKNGRVMDPASGRDEVTNIWVEDEKIIGFAFVCGYGVCRYRMRKRILQREQQRRKRRRDD